MMLSTCQNLTASASQYDALQNKHGNMIVFHYYIAENKSNQHVAKQVINKKQEVETGKLKTRRPTPSINSNGMMQEQNIHSELHVVKQEKNSLNILFGKTPPSNKMICVIINQILFVQLNKCEATFICGDNIGAYGRDFYNKRFHFVSLNDINICVMMLFYGKENTAYIYGLYYIFFNFTTLVLSVEAEKRHMTDIYIAHAHSCKECVVKRGYCLKAQLVFQKKKNNKIIKYNNNHNQKDIKPSIFYLKK
ncbi:hypothetical protein KUTeg_021599 [Tegillarca granosa]|uniref:Uncharacterized protein n=1 Tax=Tegillarca granosa TaxID=220873 RepID=A0ABQ9E4L2_TEGGR|nr:hypothetical protein KUTeg_021599 [Tegillarca granosa]